MISTFSHDAVIPGKQNAFAVVKPAPLVLSHDRGVAVSLAVPNDSVRLSAVEVIGAGVNAAKVCYAVIKSIMVDVINYVGLFAVIEEPGKPVRKIAAPIKVDAEVFTSARQRAGNVASFPGPVAGTPGQGASVWVVIKDIADRVRDALHLASMPCITRELYHG
jgi:hypothetical protein